MTEVCTEKLVLINFEFPIGMPGRAEQSKEMQNLANEKHGSVSLEMFVASLLYHEQQQQQR